MAPFIVNHPTLLNNWIFCRETALKKIRELKKVDKKDSNLFKNCVRNSIKNITSWNTDSEYQLQKINLLLHDVRKFLIFLEKKFDFKKYYPFNELYLWLEKETCDECIEYIVSIMLEPFDEIVQPLVKKMSSDEEKHFNIPTDRTTKDLLKKKNKKLDDDVDSSVDIEYRTTFINNKINKILEKLKKLKKLIKTNGKKDTY